MLVGRCGLTNFVREPFHACHLGYSLGEKYQGKGLMSEALALVIGHVFEVEKLHRIMANYSPDNARSGNLLKRLGFEIEGRARAYLKINGAWTDSMLTSLINDAV